jgi:hypothetical protein
MRSIFVIIAAAAAGCAPMHAHEPAVDARELVAFPEPMRVHTLANMRDHLQTLQQINAALGRGDFDAASTLAETRLGMTSLAMHDAAHLAAYMPKPMQEMGSAMHASASRFAIAAQDAGATHDVRPALAALDGVMRQCVACHATYRLQ